MLSLGKMRYKTLEIGMWEEEWIKRLSRQNEQKSELT